MQQIISDQIADFTAIYDEEVELVNVSRPKSEQLENLADQLFASRRVLELRWQQDALDPGPAERELQTSLDNGDSVAALAREIAFVNEVLHELLGCKEIGVRVTTLNSPMCPRFHIDAVVCRMLITVSGPGTEWIACNDVDRGVLADRSSDVTPIRDGGEVKQFSSGSMSLLKGGTWQRGFDGVVHRSPHDREQRLLLSFDPIFSD